jgi:hypothetical protein
MTTLSGWIGLIVCVAVLAALAWAIDRVDRDRKDGGRR